MKIEQIIVKAIQGDWHKETIKRFGEFKFLKVWQPDIGYRYEVIREDGIHDYISVPSIEKMVLDPSFWQGLGKAMGWKGNELCPICGAKYGVEFVPEEWQCRWHQFIDHLASGKLIVKIKK